MTKTCKFKMKVTGLLSFICTFGPFFVFVIVGLAQGSSISQRLVLTFTTITSIMLSLLSIWKKMHLRSTTYILLIGLWVVLKKLLPFIITIGICTILDELIFTPLHKKYKAEYKINSQFDKRFEEMNRSK